MGNIVVANTKTFFITLFFYLLFFNGFGQSPVAQFWSANQTRWGQKVNVNNAFADIYWSAISNINYIYRSPLKNIISFAIVKGNLPEGLSMDSNGVITGNAPNREGLGDIVYNFTIELTANDGTKYTHDYTWKVKEPVFQIFTKNTTFKYPDGFTASGLPSILCVGGGGGGKTGNYGDGGGGGAVISANIDLTPLASVSVIIGNGGIAGQNGSETSFGEYLTAQGGCAGQSNGGAYGNNNGGKNNGQCGRAGSNIGQNGVEVPIFSSAIASMFDISPTEALLGAGGGGGSWYSPGAGGKFGGSTSKGGGANAGAIDGTANTGGGGSGGGGYGGARGGGSGISIIKY